MEKKTYSQNELNSVSLEDEKDKKEFTENLIKPENKGFICLKKLIKCIHCKKSL